MSKQSEPELMEREVPSTDMATLVAINKAEIDGQITTARAFPRSNTAFIREAKELVTLDQDMAEACIFALPRGGKTITGPSARFAEVIQHSFGNNRGGARVVAEEGKFIVAQGVFHDLEKNTMTTMEVRRRITDQNGRRFKDDMIVVTGNAAASIAHRNAVLKGIPKALWLPVYEAARQVAIGDVTTLVDRRNKAVSWFMSVGVTPEQMYAKLEVEGLDDIGLPELEYLTGIRTAIREGSISPESAFSAATPDHREDIDELSETIRKRASAGKTAAKEPEPKPAPPADMDPVTGVLVDPLPAHELEVLLEEADTREALMGLKPYIAAIPDDAEREKYAAIFDQRLLSFIG